jgi:hypothetical protein
LHADSAASPLALLLKMGGNETATAHDGLAAVAAVETFRPDIVLLDISLPKLDGHEPARRNATCLISRQPLPFHWGFRGKTGFGIKRQNHVSRLSGKALCRVTGTLDTSRGH